MNLKNKKITADDALRIISNCLLRSGSVDDLVIEKGVQLIKDGAEFEAEAFALLAMHLDPDSIHAPVYHLYAHEHYTTHAEWKPLADFSRIGTPLRQIAADENIRKEVNATRTGRVLVGERYRWKFAVPRRSSPRIRRLLATLKKKTRLA